MGVEGGKGSLRPSRGVLLARHCLGAQPGRLEGEHGHPSKGQIRISNKMLAVTYNIG